MSCTVRHTLLVTAARFSGCLALWNTPYWLQLSGSAGVLHCKTHLTGYSCPVQRVSWTVRHTLLVTAARFSGCLALWNTPYWLQLSGSAGVLHCKTHLTGYSCPVQRVSCTVKRTLLWLLNYVSNVEFVSRIEPKALTINDFDSFQLSNPWLQNTKFYNCYNKPDPSISISQSHLLPDWNLNCYYNCPSPGYSLFELLFFSPSVLHGQSIKTPTISP